MSAQEMSSQLEDQIDHKQNGDVQNKIKIINKAVSKACMFPPTNRSGTNPGGLFLYHITSVAYETYDILVKQGYIKTHLDQIVYDAALLDVTGVGNCGPRAHYVALKWIEISDLTKPENVPAFIDFYDSEMTSLSEAAKGKSDHIVFAFNCEWDTGFSKLISDDNAICIDLWSNTNGSIEKVGTAASRLLSKKFRCTLTNPLTESYQELLDFKKSLRERFNKACNIFSQEFLKQLKSKYIELNDKEDVARMLATFRALYKDEQWKDKRNILCRLWDYFFRSVSPSILYEIIQKDGVLQIERFLVLRLPNKRFTLQQQLSGLSSILEELKELKDKDEEVYLRKNVEASIAAILSKNPNKNSQDESAKLVTNQFKLKKGSKEILPQTEVNLGTKSDQFQPPP